MGLFKRSKPYGKKVLNDVLLERYAEVDNEGNLYWNGKKVRTGGVSDSIKAAVIGALITATVLLLTNFPKIVENLCQYTALCSSPMVSEQSSKAADSVSTPHPAPESLPNKLTPTESSANQDSEASAK